MTVKEVAQLTGLSHQAIYKKIKSNGLKLENLKDKSTGHFTKDAEKQIRELFSIQPDDETPVESVDNQVADDSTQLEAEVAELRNQVANLQGQVDALIGERDFLRATLERCQQLQAVTLAKLPTPPPALTDGEDRKRLSFWQRLTRRKS